MDCNCSNYEHPNHKRKSCTQKGDPYFGGLCHVCAMKPQDYNEKKEEFIEITLPEYAW